MGEFYDFFGPTEAGIKMLTEERRILLSDVWKIRLEIIGEKRKSEKAALRRSLSGLMGQIAEIDAETGVYGRLYRFIVAKKDLEQQMKWTDAAAATCGDTIQLYALKELRSRLAKELVRYKV